MGLVGHKPNTFLFSRTSPVAGAGSFLGLDSMGLDSIAELLCLKKKKHSGAPLPPVDALLEPHHIGDRRHVAGRPGSSVAGCRRPSSSLQDNYPSPIGRRRATAVDARRTSLPFLDGAGDESRRPDRRRRGGRPALWGRCSSAF